jgi:hypothetical protein
MTTGVPVKELRPLADWLAELGLDGLHAGLLSGDLDAYWQHYATGEWHLVPRADWQQKSRVESAVMGFEWRLGGRWPSDLDHVCPIYAARPGAPAVPVRKLFAKAWIAEVLKRDQDRDRLKAMSITEASNVLAGEMKTARDCAKVIEPRSVEKIRSTTGLWKKSVAAPSNRRRRYADAKNSV